MRLFLIILPLVSILQLKSNFISPNDLPTQTVNIPIAPNLDSLWKIAHEEIILDSCTLIMNCSFWYTAMPGSDNSQTCWNLDLKYKIIIDRHHTDFIPVQVYFISILEDKNKNFETFAYDEKKGWMKDHKFYFNPAGVILALYNKKKNEWHYLKKTGPFSMGRVE